MNDVKDMRLGLLGYGEVGKILGADIVSGERQTIVYDVKFADNAPSNGDRVEVCESAVALGARADVIISAVTAAQTLDAAISIVASFKPGAWFVDMNSAAPATKQEAARRIEAAGGRYVEAAVMSPVPTKRLDVPILLGGPHADIFRPVGQALGFSNLTVFSSQIGKAAAAKMCRSVMVKGIEALLSEALISARHYGVEDTVITSLGDLFPGPDWKPLSKYMIERTLEHGGRRAEEMREVAETVADAGLDPLMSAATAARMDWAQHFPGLLGQDTLEDLLDALRAAAADKKRGNAA